VWAWKLIGRHLWGKNSRTTVKWMNLFALLGLAVGVFALTAVVSIMTGLQDDIKMNVLNEKSHLLWEGTPRQGLELKRNEIELILAKDLADIKFILQSEGLLEQIKTKQQARTSGSGVVIQGIDGLGEGILVGAELAKVLSLELGSEVLLRSVWQLDLPPLKTVVSDFFKSGIYETDRSVLRVDRKILEKWLQLPGAVSRLEIRLHNPLRAENYVERLNSTLGLKLKTWKETESSLWYSLRLEKIVMSLVVFFVVLLASFSVHLAVSVRVAEKTREIGLLRALGVQDNILARLYLFEGTLLGLAGSSLGLVCSFFFCKLISGYYELPDIYYLSHFPVNWNWPLCLLMASLAVILCLMASYVPAKKVESVEIAQALRS